MYSLNQRTIVFTGAASGIGRVAAVVAASQGARVVALCRNIDKGQNLLRSYITNHPDAKGTIELLECDLASLQSINNACNAIIVKYPSIDIIVNNAGTWNFEFIETTDGIENTLQVNMLAPILIINRLKDLLLKSDNPKVINTASALHQGNINFDDLEFRKAFSGFKAYRQSKLGIILLTRYYQHIFGNEGITFLSQHPGLVDTELVRKGNRISKLFFVIFGKSPEEGARTLINLLITPPQYLRGGEYYKNLKVSKTYTRTSYNLDVAQRLDMVCKKYLNL